MNMAVDRLATHRNNCGTIITIRLTLHKTTI